MTTRAPLGVRNSTSPASNAGAPTRSPSTCAVRSVSNATSPQDTFRPLASGRDRRRVGSAGSSVGLAGEGVAMFVDAGLLHSGADESRRAGDHAQGAADRLSRGPLLSDSV